MSEYILKTTNLSKKYKKDFVVDSVNISIKRGEIYGFIGENGAGKTTFIRMITGLFAPTNGEIKLFSKEKADELGNVRKKNRCINRKTSFLSIYDSL